MGQNFVTWSVRLTDQDRDRMVEMINDWKNAPEDSNGAAINRILDAAAATGKGVSSETLEAVGDAKETLLLLMKKIGAISQVNEKRLNDLHQQLNDALDRNDRLQEAKEKELTEQTEKQKVVVKELKDRIESLKTDNDQMKQESGRNAEAVAAYKTSVDSLKSQLADAKAGKTKMEEQIRVLQQDFKAATAAVDTEKSAHAADLAEQEEKHEADTKARLDAQEKQHEADTKAQLAELKAQLAEKQAEKLEGLHATIDGLQAEKLELVQKAGNLKAENGALQRKNDELEKQLDELKQQVEMLKQKAEKGE